MTAEKRRAIEADLRAGDSQRDVAFRHSVSPQTVRDVGRAAGIPPKPRGWSTRRFALGRGDARLRA